MTTKYNLKKNTQLGMTHGKASAILRKAILFKFLKETNKNICYRCNKKITKIETLSIDHKKHWLDSKDPIKTFFNLNNIAFSHISCNCKASRHKNKIIYPKGKKWCWSCKSFKKLVKFPKGATGNRNRACTECSSLKRQEYRKRTGKR